MSAPTPHRFTVDEYHRMGGAGVFREGERANPLALPGLAIGPEDLA